MACPLRSAAVTIGPNWHKLHITREPCPVNLLPMGNELRFRILVIVLGLLPVALIAFALFRL